MRAHDSFGSGGEAVAVLQRRREGDRGTWTPARVAVIDDHRTFGELLAGALDREPDLVSVGHATTAAEGIELALCARPAVVIMGVQLPDLDGFEATLRLRAALPEARVIVLTAHATPEFVARAADAGACAFLPKDGSLPVLLATIRAAAERELSIHPSLITSLAPRAPMADRTSSAGPKPERPRLTDREASVLALMGEGKDVAAMARQLRISTSTCRGYVKAVLAKLGAHSQLEAVVAATRDGMLRLEAR